MSKKSELILAELKKRKAEEAVVDVDEEKVKLVIFTLSENYYAFYGSHVKEILPFEETTYVPGSPDFILGIINIRGDIESVVNLHRVMGLSNPEVSSGSRICIASKGEMHSGVLVDTVEDVIDVPLSSIKPPLSTLDKSIGDFVTGETLYKGRNVTVMDVGRIFGKIAG